MSGYLSHGIWQSFAQSRTDASGKFVRSDSQFRERVTSSGIGGRLAETGRYLLYVSLACPWAHRTLIYRILKGLEEAIAVSVVDPVSGDDGWVFSNHPGGKDPINGFHALHEAYTQSKCDYSGLVTVPVLWDCHSGSIVNNESSEIIRMLNSEFAAFQRCDTDYFPLDQRDEIEAMNRFVYERINNGVYRCGFATTQSAYEDAVTCLFEALDQLEQRLSRQRYLVGDKLTEADLRLFPTLVRFDPVYFVHFRCCLRRISDYPNLFDYLRDIYAIPGLSATVDLDHIKRHYYLSHPELNPTRIVPRGPESDLTGPHGRGRLS